MTTTAIQEKWNNRYRDSDAVLPEPVWVLKQYDHLLPAGGMALDLACGLGGNAIFLAQAGFAVNAWDISDVAVRTLQNFSLSRRLMIDAVTRDVEREPPAPLSQDVIVVSYFLHRPLFASLAAALRPGGLIYYQTFSVDRPEGAPGPRNPDFLLQRNELLRAFSSLDVFAFHDEGSLGDGVKGLRGESAIVAQKRP